MTAADDRPFVEDEFHTADLPATPLRDRNLPGDRWIEAPIELLRLGDGIGSPRSAYKRRIGRWLLWRAGPAVGAEARYLAIDADNLTRQCVFHLHADGTGTGLDPEGNEHASFRAWKEALLAESGRPVRRRNPVSTPIPDRDPDSSVSPDRPDV